MRLANWEKRQITHFWKLLKIGFFQILKLKDGGEIGLDWLDQSTHHYDNSEYDGPIVLFLPGLTGHSQSEYIKSFVNVSNWVIKTNPCA